MFRRSLSRFELTLCRIGILVCLLTVAAGHGQLWASSQQGTNASAGVAAPGSPLTLPDGRLAIFGAMDGNVAALRVLSVGATRSPSTDLETGDLVIEFQSVREPNYATFIALLSASDQGDDLRFRIRRGEREHDLSFAMPSSSFLIPKAAAAPKGSGWVSEPDPAGNLASPPQPRRSQKELATAVKHLLAEAVDAQGPGMSVTVWHEGELRVHLARGYANLETKTTMGPQTIFPVASVSKQFTAFAIALLVIRGDLTLDDDIQDYLPELSELGRGVTIRNLLTHTSGIKDYTGLLALTGWRFGDSLNIQEFIALIRHQKELQFEPGTQHRYSNTNYALVPLIVERVTGIAFEKWMQREVFGPLGMDSTSFPATEGAIITGAASRYRPVEAGFERALGGYSLAGPGGMQTTGVDLMHWAEELRTGALGGEAVRKLMQQPTILKDGTEILYGLGVGISEYRGISRLAHAGSSPGSASVVHAYPDDGLAIAVLANYGRAEVGDLAERVAELYLGDRLKSTDGIPQGFGQPGAFMITDEHISGEGNAAGAPIRSALIASMAGRYLLDDDRELSFEANGTTLSIKLMPGLEGVPLIHLGEGRFLFPPARWEVSFDLTQQPVRNMAVHLVPGSIHRGEDRDVPGYRQDAVSLSDADRRRLVGDYWSEELGVVYRVELEGSSLFVNHPRLGRLPLTHHSELFFGLPARPLNRLRFVREDPQDESSSVVALVAEAFAWGATARFNRLDSAALVSGK